MNSKQYSLKFEKNEHTNEIESVLQVCYLESDTDATVFHPKHLQTFITGSMFCYCIYCIVGEIFKSCVFIGMFITEILLALTFAIYFCAKHLHSFYGNMLLCYLSGPMIAYALIIFSRFNEEISSSYDEIGYAVYFSFVSSFIWISLISIHLWQHYRYVNSMIFFLFRIMKRKLMILY